MDIIGSTFVDSILLVLLIALCVVASIKDVKTRKIPNWIPLTLFVFWIVGIVAKWTLSDLGLIDISVMEVLVICAKQVIAAAVVSCVLALSVVLTNKLRKKQGKAKSSVFGMGDVKLLMVVCLYLGIDGSLICALGACFTFLLYIFIARIVAEVKLTKAPFAPFILAGILIVAVIPFIV